jgi:hypothetical protein
MVYDRSNDPMANQADMRDYKPREDIQSPQGLSAENRALVERVLPENAGWHLSEGLYMTEDVEALLNAARSAPPGMVLTAQQAGAAFMRAEGFSGGFDCEGLVNAIAQGRDGPPPGRADGRRNAAARPHLGDQPGRPPMTPTKDPVSPERVAEAVERLTRYCQDVEACRWDDLSTVFSVIDHLRGEVEARGDILTLIAEGWAVIESDGRLMTIQAPDEWEWANGDEEPRELVIDTYADICTRIVPASGDQVARPQTEAGEPVKPSEEG